MRSSFFLILILGLCDVPVWGGPVYMGEAQHIWDPDGHTCFREAKEAVWAGRSYPESDAAHRQLERLLNRLHTKCLADLLRDFDRRNPARYTVILYGSGGDYKGPRYGIAWNFPDVHSAMLAAEKECENRGARAGCTVRGIARNACAAAVYAYGRAKSSVRVLQRKRRSRTPGRRSASVAKSWSRSAQPRLERGR